MQRRIVKLDARRLGVEARRDAATRQAPLADTETRRALLGELRVVETVWKRASRVQKRKLVGLLARAVRVEAGRAPVPQWYSAEALAEDVAPVNISAGVTCSPRRDVDSRFAQVLASIGVLH